MRAAARGATSGPMCGRYVITSPPEAVRSWFGYPERPNFPPRFNVAPTQPIPVVARDDRLVGAAERHLRLVRWGLVPSFVKDFKRWPLIINARAEEIATKPSFRAALARRRCLVVADGWYEWRRGEPRRAGTPFLFRRADRAPIAFAGLHERWMGADGSELDTACIVTTEANAPCAAVHGRMPVVLERADWEAWLDAEGEPPERAARLLKPCNSDLVELVEVGSGVNRVANDDPSLIEPVAAPAPRPAPPPAVERQGSLF